MDVVFETKRGPPFSIEVGYYDTVLDIKEKIHKYHGIPVQAQTLFFNGHLLGDDRHDVERCGILQDSRILLHVSSPPDPPTTTTATEDHRPPHRHHHHHSSPSPTPSPAPLTPPPPPAPSAPPKILIKIKTPKTTPHQQQHHISFEMDPNDTVLAVKEKIQEIESVHVSRLILQSNGGNELQDHRTLRDCDITNNSEITATARPVPAPTPMPAPAQIPAPAPTGSGGSSSNNKNKLKLLVVTKCATKKIPVEVNAGDNVGELRKELQRMHQKMNFPLPQEGYFFIYKQNVMEDDQSFRWHHCSHGDTIEIFNGSVTGGS